MSLDSDKCSSQPIRIMRDTCCAQSMILEGTLPFSEVSSTGSSALIQGIGMEIINVPLHKVNLKSDLVSGTVTVGVRPQLPVKGVSMLLGNDLAGGKVLPDPIVSHTATTLVLNLTPAGVNTGPIRNGVNLTPFWCYFNTFRCCFITLWSYFNTEKC